MNYPHMRDSSHIVTMTNNEQAQAADQQAKSHNMIKVGSMNFGSYLPPDQQKHINVHSEAKTRVISSTHLTPKKQKSFTIMVKAKLNRGESQPDMMRRGHKEDPMNTEKDQMSSIATSKIEREMAEEDG